MRISDWSSDVCSSDLYDEAADRLKPLLASHRIELDTASPEFRSLAADVMRCAIAAFSEAEETLEAGRLDDEALARLRERHGRTSVQQPTPEASMPPLARAVPTPRYRDRHQPAA